MTSAIDIFCGIGGLSYGLKKAGIQVKAGIDLDSSCSYPFTRNLNADFISEDISKIDGNSLVKKYWFNVKETKILVGCAPCQPFSSHTNKLKEKKDNKKWNLLNEFKRLIDEIDPEIVSMENVPNLSNQTIFDEFVEFLKVKRYYVNHMNVYCPDYGVPQKRRRLVLLASKYGKVNLISSTHTPEEYISVKDAIGNLPKVEGGEVCPNDPIHRTTKLTDKNVKRIKQSKPNGTWLDWDEELRLPCHNKKSGKTYLSVYGRMSWEEPSPTITTQFYNYGTGRFGHPSQDRALTIREAALLQTFPIDYILYEKEEDISLKKLGTHIGNAVPVRLGEVIGRSILLHLRNI
ncbi:MAG: DNA cytosine methyltransferase [Phaeodactylibacter sp.]|nr:DNA cytosine methyltransferase [Phaeodactylibacter sp.]